MAQGKSKSQAFAICNDQLKESATATIEEKDNHLYIKAFLLDSSVNLNSWGVNRETLDSNINSFIGKPIVITETFDHPESNDTFEHHINYQDKFRIGTIIDIVQKDGQYSAIAEITNEDAKQAFRAGNLPLYVSPQIYHDGVGKEPDDDASTWRGTHLAIVKEPAFTVKKARVSHQCNGNGDTCVAQLKMASCSFCIKKTIQNYVSNIENKNSSLFTQNRNQISKLENDKGNEQKSVSLEEFEKLKQSNEELKNENKNLKDLTTQKETVISELKQGNEDLKSRVDIIEKENRTKEIANVLSAVTFKTDEDRTKRLEFLVGTNLPIDVIKETYEPLVGLNATKSASTKLPQRNEEESQSKVPYFLELGGQY